MRAGGYARGCGVQACARGLPQAAAPLCRDARQHKRAGGFRRPLISFRFRSGFAPDLKLFLTSALLRPVQMGQSRKKLMLDWGLEPDEDYGIDPKSFPDLVIR